MNKELYFYDFNVTARGETRFFRIAQISEENARAILLSWIDEADYETFPDIELIEVI